MKKGKLIELYYNLLNVKELKGLKFAYGIAKNIRIIKEEIKTINEATSDYQNYEKEKFELVKSHAKKEDGKMIGHYVMEDYDKFEKEIEKLKSKHKKAIDNYEEFLDTNCETKLWDIDFEDLPDDITAGQLEGIIDLVKKRED